MLKNKKILNGILIGTTLFLGYQYINIPQDKKVNITNNSNYLNDNLNLTKDENLKLLAANTILNNKQNIKSNNKLNIKQKDIYNIDLNRDKKPVNKPVNKSVNKPVNKLVTYNNNYKNMISVNRGKYTTPLSTYADSIIYKFSDIFKIKSSLILSIIHEETRFKHNETSYTGANGLMQLEPYTFSDVSNMLRKEFPEIYYSYVAGTNSSDLQSNIVIGIYYLKYLINTYKLDISTNNYNEYILNRVLVAYNAGPGNSYQGCSSDYSRNVIKYMHEVESTKICRNND